MKKAILALVLAAGSLAAAPRFSVGVNFGAPAPVTVVRPVAPGPGYTWVDGYYAPDGVWVAGYWAAPAVVFAPRYEHARVFYDRDHFRDHDRDRDHFRR